MGYLRWPPRWWKDTSLSPSVDGLVGAEVEEGERCKRCERPPFMGRLLNVGNGQKVCVDCFCFVTGIDDRDPITDPTARSGEPGYIARTEEPPIPTPGPPDPPDHSKPRRHEERPLMGPLPPGTPWWVRLLHWFGVEMVNHH